MPANEHRTLHIIQANLTNYKAYYNTHFTSRHINDTKPYRIHDAPPNYHTCRTIVQIHKLTYTLQQGPADNDNMAKPVNSILLYQANTQKR